MSYMLKDMQPTILHVDTEVLRASIGVGELFVLPSTTIKACYGIPRSEAGSTSKAASPIPGETEDVKDRPINGWLIGPELEAALMAGGEEKWEVRWPFREDKKVQDWEGREFVLKHLLKLLGIEPATNTSPLILIPPPSPPCLPLDTQATYTQLAFENLNVPGLSIFPAPLLSLFALNATTGIILHIGRHSTEISIVIDSVVRWECSTTVHVGEADCEAFFENLLMQDEGLEAELVAAKGSPLVDGEKRKLVKQVAEVVWRECTGDDVEIPVAKSGLASVVIGATQTQEDEGTIDVAKKLANDTMPPPTNTSHKSKKQQAAATAAANAAAAAVLADVISINIPSFPEKEINLGPVRHRLAEPLLRGKTTGSETVWEAMGRAVESPSLGLAERMAIWEGVGIVGDLVRFKSLPRALITYLAPFLLSSTDVPSEIQPARVRLLSIPEYFTNYKGATTDLAPFLGGQMIAKVAFNDSMGKHCITKVDYNLKGPAAIYAVNQGE
ncbi:actin-related protein 9, partial [Tremellales sp. Uapishka_1]